MITREQLDSYRYHGCDDEQYFALIAEVERLYDGIHAVIKRYERPEEPHNRTGGFPRPELAWAMAQDLYELMKVEEQEIPD